MAGFDSLYDSLYDAASPGYLDEAEVRGELSRTFDVCGSCRDCVDLCGVFPTLFELLERTPDGSAGSLTPAEQDQVVDQCFHCNRCRTACPAAVGVGDATLDAVDSAIDVPRLVLRTLAMWAVTHRRPIGHGVIAGKRAQRDAMSHIAASGAAPTAQRRPLGRLRSRERFSTWFARRRGRVDLTWSVVVVPTCLVEYAEPDLGRDVVALLEHSGASCTTASVDCCGAPWLHAGDLKRFRRHAERNVRALDAGAEPNTTDGGPRPIAVMEPTCRQVMADSYVDHVDTELRDAARRVVDRLVGPVELARRALARSPVPVEALVARPRVIVHRSCHERDEDAADLLRALGCDVAVVDGCAGIGGDWDGINDRAVQVRLADGRTAGGLVAAVSSATDRWGDDATEPAVVVGGCGVANAAIAVGAGRPVRHAATFAASLLAAQREVGGRSPEPGSGAGSDPGSERRTDAE